MNRWRRWAERIRARHGQREGGYPGGTFVFARGSRFVSQIVKTNSRTVLYVRPNLSVTMRVITPPARLSRTGHATVSSEVRTVMYRGVRAGVPPALRARPGERGAAPTLAGSSLTFVDARHVRSGLTSVERHVERFHDLVDRWRSKPIAAIEARDLPGRVRRRAAREDMSMGDVLRAVPVLHHRRSDATQSSRETSTGPEASARGRGEVPAPAPAVPTINVEALTSQVIHQLDRRLIAYRERMGRG